MWHALENASKLVKTGGKLFIAIYNDQSFISSYWLFVKKTYNMNFLFKFLIILIHFPYFILLRSLVRFIKSRKIERGMDLFNDMLDWLGGYPFEVAKPKKIIEFLKLRGFSSLKVITVENRQGCNEFVMLKNK